MKITIDFRNVELDIECDYQSEEAQVSYYSDGSGYPGCPAYVEIYNVSMNGINLNELLEELQEEIEDATLEAIEQ